MRRYFATNLAARLGYEQHLLLLVTEDLWLYTTEDALAYHLAQLAAAYRRAGDAYRKAENEGSAVHDPLWQMASLATRMRLEAWVYHARHGESPQLVLVIGAGPAALSCAYYLSLAGCEVTMYARETQPGGGLWEKSASDPDFRSAVLHDMQGIMESGIIFQAKTGKESLHPREIPMNYRALFLTDSSFDDALKTDTGWLDTQNQDNRTGSTLGIFSGEDFLTNGTRIVEAVACGRKAALEISQFLASQGNG